ncbi:MAG: hypothetical protein JRJ60_14110 [Deltaproteobacteria bacterium]|nr:hypothetical protein [Deltaproteobacteria bacterium]
MPEDQTPGTSIENCAEFSGMAGGYAVRGRHDGGPFRSSSVAIEHSILHTLYFRLYQQKLGSFHHD